jgi:SAM-dependent methyltransferase
LQKDDFRRFNMVRDLCVGKNVIDFGCGYGGFLNYISDVATKCSGVELGKQERDYLNSMGLRCFKTIDEMQEKADVITLFHTFEHLNHPKLWLNKFSDHLTEGGYLIIEVPNANDILLSMYENSKFADFTYWSLHLFLYTKKSLSMTINDVGKFDILSAGQVQRYPLSNHLMWLAKGLPGGHNTWSCLNSNELDEAYFKKLEELEMCDTLFFILNKR